MGMLKWFNREKYNGLGEVLSAIRQELKSLQPTDSSDIVWSKSANGMSAKLRGNNATSTQNEVEDSPIQAQSSYNGYFAIKVRNGENGRPSHIVVCDGATYDAEKHTSGDMLVAVNGVTSWLPYWQEELKSEYGSGQKYIVAEYVPPRVNDNNETVKEKIQLVIVDDPVKYANNEEKKDEKITERYTQLIGSFKWNSTAGTVSVIQRHGTANAYYANNGMLYIEYFSACNSVQKDTDTEG